MTDQTKIDAKELDRMLDEIKRAAHDYPDGSESENEARAAIHEAWNRMRCESVSPDEWSSKLVALVSNYAEHRRREALHSAGRFHNLPEFDVNAAWSEFRAHLRLRCAPAAPSELLMADASLARKLGASVNLGRDGLSSVWTFSGDQIDNFLRSSFAAPTAPAEPIPASPGLMREVVDCLLDIWDERNLPEEHRCYASGAFEAEMERARSLLASPAPAPEAATMPKKQTAKLSRTIILDPEVAREVATPQSDDGLERSLSELVDKIVPGLDSGDILADAHTASKALDQTPQQSDDARVFAGRPNPEVAEWQYRTYFDGCGGEPIGWGEWERVVARSRLSTVEDEVANIRRYIEQGGRYELRALGIIAGKGA